MDNQFFSDKVKNELVNKQIGKESDKLIEFNLLGELKESEKLDSFYKSGMSESKESEEQDSSIKLDGLDGFDNPFLQAQN